MKDLRTIEGEPVGRGRRVAVVAARFNAEVTNLLLEGAVAQLRKRGVADGDLLVVRVPGAFELPVVAQKIAEDGDYHAVIALGAVIRGETDHYDYVCDAAGRGCLDASLATGVPVLFGVLTCDTEEQALDRCGGAHGHKGADVADAALETADVIARLGDSL